MVAAAIAGSAAIGLAGSAMSSSAAGSAGKTQANAQLQAAQMQQQQNQQNIANLSPYNFNGQASLPNLNSQYGNTQQALGNAYQNVQNNIPKPMTQAQLVQTPGYQFNLNQGLQAVQNSNAAHGLGISSNALNSAAQFATGLADSAYQNQFNNLQSIYGDYNNQFSNAYNMQNSLYNQAYGPAALGESAAAQSGALGNQAALNAGTNIAGSGASLASGMVGGANALNSGLQNAGGLGLAYALNQQNNPSNTSYSKLDPYGQSVAPNTWSSQPDAYYLPGGAGYKG